jgi:hypothetical protein
MTTMPPPPDTSARLAQIEELYRQLGDDLAPKAFALARECARGWPAATISNRYDALIALGAALNAAGLAEAMQAAFHAYGQRYHREPETLTLLRDLVEGPPLLAAIDRRIESLQALRRACSQPTPRPVAPAAASA